MIRFCLMLFLVGLSADAQKLELKIDSITANDRDEAQRVYNVYYHLENLTQDRLRFFLDTSNIIPSTGGSGSDLPFYKLYENDAFLEIGSVFSGSGTKRLRLNEVEFKAARATINQEKTNNTIVEMAPEEIKNFSMDFHWDRNRYYQNHNMEYYLQEKAKHFLEITMVLQKANNNNRLPDDVFNEITVDKHFIEGVFTSNKKEIDFSNNK